MFGGRIENSAKVVRARLLVGGADPQVGRSRGWHGRHGVAGR
jgi:hypothetical protein